MEISVATLHRIEDYKGHQLHINHVEDNPNGRLTQTVLIYNDVKFVGASHADIDLENAVVKAKRKVDLILT